MFEEMSVGNAESSPEKGLLKSTYRFLHPRETVNCFHPLGQPRISTSLNSHVSQQYV